MYYFAYLLIYFQHSHLHNCRMGRHLEILYLHLQIYFLSHLHVQWISYKYKCSPLPDYFFSKMKESKCELYTQLMKF